MRPALRQVFVDLVQGSVADYLARFEFRSELLVSMYAVTDGLSGLNAGPDDPGTGHNFLVHNMCRLPGSGGTWMIAEGGMGTVSRTFAEAARAAGATILTGTPVSAVTLDGGAASGVVLADGRQVAAKVVLGACDPYRLMDLLPDGALPAPLGERMAAVRRPGTTLKLNLALTGLPRFSCLPADAPSPFGSTIHLLPGSASLVGGDDTSPMTALRSMWADVQAGRLPAEPTIEWYLHTTVDPSLSDAAGHHSSALFVQSVPYELAGTTWDAALPDYVDRLIGIVERYAPGTCDLIADAVPLPRPASRSTSASPAGTSTTSTTRSRSPTGCPTPPASTACTPAAPAATRPAASSARQATTPPAESSRTWAADPDLPQKCVDHEVIACRGGVSGQ